MSRISPMCISAGSALVTNDVENMPELGNLVQEMLQMFACHDASRVSILLHKGQYMGWMHWLPSRSCVEKPRCRNASSETL